MSDSSSSYGAVLFLCEHAAAGVFSVIPSFVLDWIVSVKKDARFLNTSGLFLWFGAAGKKSSQYTMAGFTYIMSRVCCANKDAVPVPWDEAVCLIHVSC